MATDIEICNAALVLIGDQPITSLSSGSPSDRELACRTLYPGGRDFVLRSHPWNCAVRRTILTDPGMSTTDKSASATVAGQRVRNDATSTAWHGARGLMPASSGTRYFEALVEDAVAGAIGVSAASLALTAELGQDATAWAYRSGGQKRNTNSNTSYGAAWTRGDVVGVLWDATAASLTFYLNGTSQGVAYASGVTGSLFPAVTIQTAGGAVSMRLAASEWTRAPASVGAANAWPQDAIVPESDYSVRLTLPTDALRLLSVGSRYDVPDYQLEGRAILCNETRLPITYVADVAESAFDQALREALEAYMAAQLAYALAKSGTLQQSMAELFERKLRTARLADGQEQPIEMASDYRLMRARHSSAYRGYR